MQTALRDRHGRSHSYLRISLTDRCNFRCVYCMPADGLIWRERQELLTDAEIRRLAGIFVDLGVDKIRLTGGEPTVRPSLLKILASLGELPGLKRLSMTSNGLTLLKSARDYKAAGLTGLNISIDSLQRDRFAKITRRDRLPQVMAGIEEALNAGIETVKINVVVMRGENEDEILDFVEFVKDRPLNVRFIEVMPFKGNGWEAGEVVSYKEMRALIGERYELKPMQQEHGDVAKDFTIDGFTGSVSFITSMTESFCGSCNRIRLTAEGHIKPCLFAPMETSLRDPMRAGATDDELTALIQRTLWMKSKGHAPMNELPMLENRSMIQIGG